MLGLETRAHKRANHILIMSDAAPKKPGRRRSSLFKDDSGRLLRGSVRDLTMAVKSGNMQKLSTGTFKRWQRRYFVISGHYLKYYESDPGDNVSGAKVKGAMNLLNLSKCEMTNQNKNEFEMTSHELKMKLRAENAEHAKEWLDAIEVTTEREKLQQAQAQDLQVRNHLFGLRISIQFDTNSSFLFQFNANSSYRN